MPTPNYYPLYEHWYKTMNWLLDRCDRMPKYLRFTISGRMVIMATDILAILPASSSPMFTSMN